MARPKLRSPDQPFPVRFLLGLYEALASLRLAVFLIVASAVVLGWATVVESRFGTEAVQFGIYGTWWFASLVALLGANVLAAALVRFPWKRHQTGFVITHAGIIVLLAGCLLSRLGGIDAQMPIFEGHTGHVAFEDSQHFELKIEPLGGGTAEARTVTVPFAPGPFNWQDYSADLVRLPFRDYTALYWFPWRLAHRDWGRIYDHEGVQLDVLDYYSDSRLVPAPPIKLQVRSGKTPPADKGKPQAPAWTTVSLDVRGVADPHSPHGRMGLGGRQQLPAGPRIVFWVAKNQAETEAFLKSGPVGEVTSQGQLVFHVAGQKYPIPLDKFQQKTRQPLGTTGLEVELVRLDPQFLGAVLQVHAPNDTPRRVVLLADFPEFSQQDDEHGVYGEYWVDAKSVEKDAKADPDSIHHPERPRIDILQGADRRLYYRTWVSPRIGTIGPLPLDGKPITAFADSATPVDFFVAQFAPHDLPGVKIEPAPFAKRRDSALKDRRVRLRLTVDGKQEEFWLAGLPKDPLGMITQEDQRRVAYGDKRRVAVTLPWDKIDLGFQLYLHKFQRKLDPGSAQASHYSSLVELRDGDGKPTERAGSPGDHRILITLNQPVNFSDSKTGRSYRIYQEAFRGPWKPGDPEFDQLVGGNGTREELFLSWLTVNYDPGRGLKYTGSLLIVAGIATMFYMRAYFFRRPMRQTISLLCFVLVSSIASPAWARGEAELDWSAWQHMPVFDNGRMMPVNTFARAAAERITGRANPRLSLEGAAGPGGAEPDGLEQTRSLFPGGKVRPFSSAELLFSWLVEPERWHNVPFLVAGHEELRKEVLGLPLLSPGGQRLKYASPWQVENSRKFGMQLMLLQEKQKQAEAKGEKSVFTALDEKVRELYEAYTYYRRLTFDPASAAAERSRYFDRLSTAVQAWRKLEPDLKRLAPVVGPETEKLLAETGDSLQKLITLSESEATSLGDLQSQVVAVCRLTRRLAEVFGRYKQKTFTASTGHGDAAQGQPLRTQVHALAVGTADLASQANEAHRALYDNGYALRLVPALDPAPLEKNRDPSDDAQPWLSFQTLVGGSEAILSGYPPKAVQEVRRSFRQAADVYCDRSDPGRPARFAAAMSGFASAVRQLGEQTEPLRKKLAIRQKDVELIAATAYPPPDYTRAEVHYYRLDPFFWSWLVSLLAMTSFGLAFGLVRKPMFLLGLLVLLGAQLLTIYGLGLRVYITGWAPVTNMFETVIFVALVVGLMGLWFTVLPVVWPGLNSAWRLTAIPGTPEATPLGKDQLLLAEGTTWNVLSFALLLPRAAIALAIFWLLAVVPYGSDGGYTVVKLMPRIDVGSSTPTLGNVVVWLVGLSMLGLAIWLLPRTVLAGAASIVTVPYALARQGLRKPLDEMLARKPFAMVGAAVGFLAALVAYYAPVFDQNINPLMPVLRDNFWLTMHVLTITASYGAGALAWGLGNLALGYYLFGRYRDPQETIAESPEDQRSEQSSARRAPEVCDTLGTFVYKSMQVAVLLLAAGTILGGLWADVSWGRFWGWDSKEVWALVSLLIYLAILHGRYAGMLGNFGLAVGSVFGATAILMAWYGVNYVLGSGLHSYGEGTGGFLWVLAILVLNWIFVGLAALRYLAETSPPRA